MAEKKTKLNDIPIKFRSRFADIPKDPNATKYDREGNPDWSPNYILPEGSNYVPPASLKGIFQSEVNLQKFANPYATGATAGTINRYEKDVRRMDTRWKSKEEYDQYVRENIRTDDYGPQSGVEGMLPEMAAALGISAVIAFGANHLNELRHFVNDKSKSSSTADVAKQLAKEIKANGHAFIEISAAQAKEIRKRFPDIAFLDTASIKKEANVDTFFRGDDANKLIDLVDEITPLSVNEVSISERSSSFLKKHLLSLSKPGTGMETPDGFTPSTAEVETPKDVVVDEILQAAKSQGQTGGVDLDNPGPTVRKATPLASTPETLRTKEGLINRNGSISFDPPKKPAPIPEIDNRQRFGMPGREGPQQGPLQLIQKGPGFDDMGREDARIIREDSNPNTRYIDKPLADPQGVQDFINQTSGVTNVEPDINPAGLSTEELPLSAEEKFRYAEQRYNDARTVGNKYKRSELNENTWRYLTETQQNSIIKTMEQAGDFEGIQRPKQTKAPKPSYYNQPTTDRGQLKATGNNAALLFNNDRIMDFGMSSYAPGAEFIGPQNLSKATLEAMGAVRMPPAPPSPLTDKARAQRIASEYFDTPTDLTVERTIDRTTAMDVITGRAPDVELPRSQFPDAKFPPSNTMSIRDANRIVPDTVRKAPDIPKPAKPPEVPVVKNGGVSMDSILNLTKPKPGVMGRMPSRRASLAEVAVELAAESLVQPVGDLIFDNALKPLIENIKGEQVPTSASIRELRKYEADYKEQMKVRDALNATQYQGGLNELDDLEGAPPAPQLPPPTPEAKPARRSVRSNERTKSKKQRRSAPEQKPLTVKQQQKLDKDIQERVDKAEQAPAPDKNAEYKRRLKALGPNPTKAERDAVRDYGLAKHAKNFPQLVNL